MVATRPLMGRPALRSDLRRGPGRDASCLWRLPQSGGHDHALGVQTPGRHAGIFARDRAAFGGRDRRDDPLSATAGSGTPAHAESPWRAAP